MEKMRPHLLFCYTESPISLKIIDYLRTLFDGSSLRLTLYHLVEIPSSLLLPQRDYLKEVKREEALENFCREAKERTLGHFERISQALRETVDLQVDYVIDYTEGDKAEKLLHFLEDKAYSAVVMGKRGLGRLASIWAGSFTQKMILYAKQPLWIIRAKEPNKKILVAFDTGERGLKVLEYTFGILSYLKDYQVTLFHALIWLGSSFHLEGSFASVLPRELPENLKETLQEAQKLLTKYNLPEERIKLKLSSHFLGPASAILREVRREGYSTVVIGKRGRGGFAGLLLGSVATKLVSLLEREALWLVP